jgi:hypothetical protein
MTVWRNDEIEQMKKLASEGATYVRAAARLGRTTVAIRVKAKELGVEFKTKREARVASGLSASWAQNR